jgi:hypothetical protein
MEVQMKKLLKVLSVCLLLIVIIGCSSKPNLPGEYEISALKSEEDGDMADQLALLKEYGLQMKLTLYEDGTGVFDMLGQKFDLTYDAENMVITFETFGKTDFTFKDDVITFEADGSELSLKKIIE